jgi:hypothetical protein
MTPESADIQPVGARLSRDISKGEAVDAELLADRLEQREAELAKEQGRRRGVDKEE